MKSVQILVAVLGLAAAAAAAEPVDYNADYARALDELSGAGVLASPRVARQFGRGGVRDRDAMDAGELLARLLDAHWTWTMRSNPEWATYTGFAGQDHRWSDPSLAARSATEALEKRTLDVARGIDADALTPAEQLNLDLFLYELETEVAGHAYPGELILVTPMWGIHTGMARTLSAMPLFKQPQLDNYLARLRAMPATLQAATAVLREGIKRGITPPGVTLKVVPDQVRGLFSERPADSPLLKPLHEAPDELTGIAEARRQAAKIYAEQLVPALSDFLAFLEDEYLPGAVQHTGLSRLPDGEAWYAWLVRKMTTTELSPRQIHERGLAEVERIRQEMYAVMREAGYDKQDIRGFAKRLNRDKSQFYTQAEHMLRDYRAMAKQADAGLVKLFRRYPTLPYGIEAIPAHEAAGRSGAYYTRGSAANGRPGIFNVNTSRLAETPKYEMQALLLHEAVPGHHFQLALAQDQGELPAFRRHGGFTAFIEGWGLYAEGLGEHFGFYQTPEDRFGALTFEMWRAIRLVVDTGMHALGWSRQQAIDFFTENTGRGATRIEAEVNRYLVMPGQALAYKMGQLKILELRERARAELGDDFDIRAYHDFVLGEGALPLQVLERRVDAWIARQGHASS